MFTSIFYHIFWILKVYFSISFVQIITIFIKRIGFNNAIFISLSIDRQTRIYFFHEKQWCRTRYSARKNLSQPHKRSNNERGKHSPPRELWCGRFAARTICASCACRRWRSSPPHKIIKWVPGFEHKTLFFLLFVGKCYLVLFVAASMEGDWMICDDGLKCPNTGSWVEPWALNFLYWICRAILRHKSTAL